MQGTQGTGLERDPTTPTKPDGEAHFLNTCRDSDSAVSLGAGPGTLKELAELAVPGVQAEAPGKALCGSAWSELLLRAARTRKTQ